MRPSPAYHAAHRDSSIPSPVAPTPTNIPPHLRDHVEDGLATGVRKGKCRNKVGMWGNLSPYWSNNTTIDSRWTQTVSNRNA